MQHQFTQAKIKNNSIPIQTSFIHVPTTIRSYAKPEFSPVFQLQSLILATPDKIDYDPVTFAANI